MRHPRIVTLTTDFGPSGPYVASLKGILLGSAPGVTLVDVSHSIAPQNILEGSFVLAGIVDSFPAGTIHLVVVDPGVGSSRRLLAVRASDQWFVLPDNGLITGVLRTHPVQQVRLIDSPTVRRPVVSSTFHGRDLLAPAAAHLAHGGDPMELGPEVDRLVRLSNFEPRPDGEGFIGEVIFRDAFGNLITNIQGDQLRDRAPLDQWSIALADQDVTDLCQTYSDREPGSLIGVIGSCGWIEVAVVNGDACRHLGAGPGATVWMKRRTVR